MQLLGEISIEQWGMEDRTLITKDSVKKYSHIRSIPNKAPQNFKKCDIVNFAPNFNCDIKPAR